MHDASLGGIAAGRRVPENYSQAARAPGTRFAARVCDDGDPTHASRAARAGPRPRWTRGVAGGLAREQPHTTDTASPGPAMSDSPLWLEAVLFLVAALIIWWAGTRLERYTDLIARRTGLGRAFSGMLLLAGVTSLPEVVSTITAVAVLDNPTLAVHNLLGGVAFQTAILAVADAVKRRRGALTFFSPHFVLLVEGVGLLAMIQIAVAGVTTRGVPTVASVSSWLVALLLTYVGLMHLVHRFQGQPRWTPTRTDDVPEELQRDDAESDDLKDERATSTIWLLFATMGVLVVGGGWLATRSADVLAEGTGLGSAFLGATLLASATSLPELSTTIAAARNDRYTVAISNVFGSNALTVVLLCLAEALYRGGTILAHAEPSLILVATIGALMTCIYLWGLMERENRTIFGIGVDSAAVVLVYLGGMTVLYLIQ